MLIGCNEKQANHFTGHRPQDEIFIGVLPILLNTWLRLNLLIRWIRPWFNYRNATDYIEYGYPYRPCGRHYQFGCFENLFINRKNAKFFNSCCHLIFVKMNFTVNLFQSIIESITVLLHFLVFQNKSIPGWVSC